MTQKFHDSCGIAFLANTNNIPTNKLINLSLSALENMEHRGGTGAEENTGDGAGILISMPHKFLQSRFVNLGDQGTYLVGNMMIEDKMAEINLDKLSNLAKEENLEITGSIQLETNNLGLGKTSLECEPKIYQIALKSISNSSKLDILGWRFKKRVRSEFGFYFCSLSSTKLVYKGMLTTNQLRTYYKDLQNENLEAKLCLVHSRFSTNTIPKWSLAQPFSNIAHNGEINTIKGNRNWFNARESLLKSDILGDLEKIKPILTSGVSDSASFDEVLEILNLSGRSLPHSALMMIPPAYEKDSVIDSELKAFYDYNSTIIEPWDGPASLTFSDGNIVGSILDRDGFRPGRYSIYDDGLVVMASETGVLNSLLDQSKIVKLGRLNPGEMFLVDTVNGKIIQDSDIKETLKKSHPYKQWLDSSYIKLDDLPIREPIDFPKDALNTTKTLFSLTDDKVKDIIIPTMNDAKEPIGSMGNDTPLAFLSKKDRSFFDHFTTRFAQVTNPPLDWEREKNVTSLSSSLGPEPNLLEDSPLHAKKIFVETPVLKNSELAKIERISNDGSTHLKTKTINCTYQISDNPNSLSQRLDEICLEADKAIENGCNILVLSDRYYNNEKLPIPSFLFTSTIHNHLIRTKKRTQISLIVEAGDVFETHHLTLLISVGAGAVNPYLAIETIKDLANNDEEDVKIQNYLTGLSNGLLKIMSKSGVCTIMSFRGSALFDTIGVSPSLLEKYFNYPSSNSNTGDLVDISFIHKMLLNRHRQAYRTKNYSTKEPTSFGGEYQYNQFGEYHSFNPLVISKLQLSVQNKDWDLYKEFADLINNPNNNYSTIRSKLEIRSDKKAIENIGITDNTIITRLSTGAMSFGSLSDNVHEDIARAMNRIGSRSNSGEGGEKRFRYNDESLNSKIKQVASGRFGVHIDYLTSAKIIQIKLAQGAKPGEGGHLPGTKVFPAVATVRSSTPGVGLISPPPHHDIYSIEDLKQLIFDLKMANPTALISVKLTSETGVGLVASGVAKCRADLITISGFDGGTGASPLSSIKHSGKPFETGIFEAHTTLLENGLRNKVKLLADGGIKTGKDIVYAALLGADEYSVASTALITLGCIMYKKCNSNKCPVGIATQNKDLIALYKGKPEYLINYFEFLQMEVNEILHSLGYTKLEEIVGKWELLKDNPLFDSLFGSDTQKQNIEFDKTFDLDKHPIQTLSKESRKLNDQILEAFEKDNNNKFVFESLVTNVDLAVGTLLSSTISKTKDKKNCEIKLKGSAGQSLGSFLNENIEINLKGDVNDFCAKGLCGGKITVSFGKDNKLNPYENIIAGNAIAYGATSGKAYFAGIVGERFGVRNSGAKIVCLGTGDHALEYMSGGTAIILGKVGKNFGAGFLGGRAYLLDINKEQLKLNDDYIIKQFDDINNDRKWLVSELLDDFSKSTGLNLDIKEIQSHLIEVTPLQFEIVEKALFEFKGSDTELEDNWSDFYSKIEKEIEQVKSSKKNTNIFPKNHQLDCLECGVPFCNFSCPLGNNIPLINKLVSEEKFDEAYKILEKTSNFPEFTSLICPALCEGGCVKGINNDPVQIKNNEKTVAFWGIENNKLDAKISNYTSGKTIAIVGSGPAGLVAAQQLARSGHTVKVFEEASKPGGILRYGIPEEKLPKQLIDNRIEQLKNEGVRFECNTKITDLQSLRNSFDSVLLAIGSRIPRSIPVLGKDAKNVKYALDFLTKHIENTKYSKDLPSDFDAKDKRVLIIGQGDSGNDCLRASLNQGAKFVTALQILPEPNGKRTQNTPWPSWYNKNVLTDLEKEAISFNKYKVLYQSTISGVKIENEEVKSVKISKVNGFEIIQNTDFEEEFDLILVSIGFINPDTSTFDIKLDERNNIYRNEKFETSINRVYACGDSAIGQSLVVRAMQEGRKAAKFIDESFK